ncbi:acyltransferase family protein [Flavobacterium sp. Sd200]|uniref:acyltransferase family protein n=1 Tax=Flavobacterium sp. Sd200 TaxID=2692211 RepID=UPI00136BA5F3|nr:acyltransferase family protein [Flavobacterium sp. Sd200]MXN91993.1 acyltransferase family protein [Flavobacterium sp. Sd200]
MGQAGTDRSFRYDINALRALAIIGVVFYHFKPEFLSGGFAGVDVFFVISGYLMSRVVIGQIDKGSFSFLRYFEKRLYRIVPALVFLVAVIAALCFFIYLPNDYKPNVQNGASALLFLSNLFFWYNTPSYFDASSDTNLFLHTWSLSVEWQFYLLYPFLLLLFNRLFKNKRVYKSVFIALTVVLFIVSVVVSHYFQSFSFYMLPTRAWEMLLGGIAFFAEGSLTNSRTKKIFALSGYAVILSCFFVLDESLPWPGFYTLLPVLATFLIIAANVNFKFTHLSFVQFTGKISYSLYLWHWPVFVIAQYYGLGKSVLAVGVYIILSVMLGYISYRYVESIHFNRKLGIGLGVVSVFTVVFCVQYFNVNRVLYDNKTLSIANNVGITSKPFFRQYRKDTCFVESFAKYKKQACLCFDDAKSNVLLIGDSHLAQLSQSLMEGFPEINFLQATAPATLPTIKSYYTKRNNLRELMDYVYKDFIPNNADKIDGIIISGNWAGQRLVQQDSLVYGINEAVDYLKRYNIPVVVIGQTERYSVSYPTIAARAHYFNSDNHAFYLDEYTVELNSYLSQRLKNVYINVLNEKNVPPLSPKNVTYMRDKDHVTKYGADLLINCIKRDKLWIAFWEDIKIESTF